MAASQNVVHRVTASASPENLLGIQILGPHLSPTKSETLRVGTSNLCFYVSHRILMQALFNEGICVVCQALCQGFLSLSSSLQPHHQQQLLTFMRHLL